MFRLIRLVLSLIVLGGVVYFAVAVPIGSKTLWQHLKAIAGSKESQELVEEVKHKATKALHSDSGPPSLRRGEKAGDRDRLSKQERELLRKLIKDKLEEQ